MNLRITEALALAKNSGRKVLKKDLATILFPDCPAETQAVNMSNLCTGRTKRIKPEWVVVICKMCGCTADFLFGLEK